MKQNVGWLTAIGVAVAALFGLSVLPSRNAPATPTRAQEKEVSPRENASPSLDALKPPCWEIETRIRHFLPAKKIFAPPDCYEKPSKPAEWTLEDQENSSKLQFLIATLPDPVHTHFSLQFDRFVDAVQRAAQDENFIYDSSWLPWVEQPRQWGGLTDQDTADKRQYFREKQPGLMVFRKSCVLPYQVGLLVFIVGENPTGGIDVEQFESAIDWIKALRPHGTKCSLRILSPVFSGSFPSLAKALSDTVSDISTVVIFSGSATSREGIDWFRKFLAQQKSDHRLLARFETFQESDDLMINRYCRMLNDQRYDVRRLAIISEDETAYGAKLNLGDNRDPALCGCVKDRKRGPLSLYYPRDIASLRIAYAKQAPVSGGQSARGLPQNLSEASHGERDTIRTYGGEQTPLSQESTLFELVNLLDAHQIEFIVLRSSNVLDQIFLTSFLARTYPVARVVILNSDLMFGRSTETQGFRGTMTLSTYPLLTWQQDWTSPPDADESAHSHRVFADAKSEGLYVASRLLIHLKDIAKPELCLPLQDYGPPSWLLGGQLTRPPTWLSVLGVDRLWPVAAIDESKDPIPSTLPWVHTGAKNHGPPLRPPMSTWVCFTIVLLWCGLHLCCCWYVSRTATPRCRAYFAPVPGVSHDVLIFFGCMLFVLLAVVAYNLTSTPFEPQSPFRQHWWMILFYTLWFVMSVLALIGNFVKKTGARLSRLRQAERFGIVQETIWTKTLTPGNFWIGIVVVRGVIVALSTAALWLIFYFTMPATLDCRNDVFTVWRSVNLFSGVSPLTPLLVLIVGSYGWFWCTLAGLALFNEDCPRLPEGEDLERWFVMFSREETGRPIEQLAKPFDSSYLTVLSVVFIILAGILFTRRDYFMVRTLGPKPYGLVYSVWLCLFIALILAEASQMLRIWSRLRKLLVNLDRLPLRRTLYALRGFSWGTVWKMGGSVLEQRYKLLSRQIEAYGHLRNGLEQAEKDVLMNPATKELPKPPPLDKAYHEQLKACDQSQKEFVEWYLGAYKVSSITDLEPAGHYQEHLAKMAGAVCRTILTPQWRKEGQSLIQDLSQPLSENAAPDKREVSFPPIPDFQRQAEEFFALPYLGFIQNILGRVRTISIGLFWLFTTATISFVSYPFDPRPVLGGIFLLLFVLVGAVVFFVYAGMHRDTTLSHITNTTPGELGWAFWAKLAAIGIGPLLAVLTALFPAMAGFLTSWLQPSVEAIK